MRWADRDCGGWSMYKSRFRDKVAIYRRNFNFFNFDPDLTVLDVGIRSLSQWLSNQSSTNSRIGQKLQLSKAHL